MSTKSIAQPVLVAEPGATASPSLDGSDLHVGLLSTRHCHEVVSALAMACRGELLLKGVQRPHIHELQVSQPFDLPFALKRMLEGSPVPLDAVVVVGCLVRGESLAFDFVAEAVTRACMKIGMKMHTPVINGVLTCADDHQAHVCAGLDPTRKTRACNFGVEWAQSAIDMGHMNRKVTAHIKDACECTCHPYTAKGAIATAFSKQREPQQKNNKGKCGDCGHEGEKTTKHETQ